MAVGVSERLSEESLFYAVLCLRDFAQSRPNFLSMAVMFCFYFSL
jgi:hypothetical protein